jgi:hypothetical protein
LRKKDKRRVKKTYAPRGPKSHVIYIEENKAQRNIERS